MKMHKMLITLAGLMIAVATTGTVAAYTLAGNGSNTPAEGPAGTQEPAFQDDKVLLIDSLLATGAEVKVSGEVVSADIFSVEGVVLEVNGERVLVMDYGDAAALEAEAAGVSPSGSSVATQGKASMIFWVEPPHFFRSETAIVLYVGENPKVIEALTSVLGPQFAGR